MITKREVENFRKRDNLLRTLQTDLQTSLAEVSVDLNNQYRQRTLVRTLFAYIDGSIAVYKQNLLELYNLSVIELTTEQFQRLIEKPIPTKNEPSKLKPVHSKLTENVKFTFSLYEEKITRVGIKVDTNSKEWNIFL